MIRGWWETWPNAMIGLVTGARSGLYVVDIDVKEGRDGMAAYRALNVPKAENCRANALWGRPRLFPVAG